MTPVHGHVSSAWLYQCSTIWWSHLDCTQFPHQAPIRQYYSSAVYCNYGRYIVCRTFIKPFLITMPIAWGSALRRRWRNYLLCCNHGAIPQHVTPQTPGVQ